LVLTFKNQKSLFDILFLFLIPLFPMTISPQILVSDEGAVRYLTISQPSKKNAISIPMSAQLRDMMSEALHDDSVRVVVLQGADGDFCAGADLDLNVVSGGFDVSEFLQTHYNPMVLAMRQSDKPIIAKVRGNAVGVGCNFALACDMIFADETARFSQIFSKIGLSTDGGGAYFMLEKLGYHRAFELIAMGDIIDAPMAAELGLINRVVPSESLDNYVDSLAERLATGPYLAIQGNKANLRAAIENGLAATLKQEAVTQGVNFTSKDFFEGVMAFVQKRKPEWRGE
jgi:2-(1,2-epoxy-1,2-dihydrophenyl)acetyl-CoA isomerase